jgi:hypothetical protein
LTVRLALVCCVLLVMAGPTRAQESPPDRDRIVLRLTEESWVETQSARVAVELKALLTGEGQHQSVDPQAIFQKVSDADWRIVRFDRGQTDTGFEQWTVTAETRLPQSALAGIYDRVKQASDRGRTLSVMEIDVTPSLAEREATAARLRAVIYQRAADEAAQVAKVLPDKGFRVHRVDFEASGIPQPVLMRSAVQEKGAFSSQDAAASAPAFAAPVAERMVLSATVVIAAEADADIQ